MRCRSITIIILASGWVAACGDATDEGAVPTDIVTEALELLDDPWCVPFAERFCEAARSCSCSLASGFPEDCEAAARAQCRGDLRVQAEQLSEAGFLVSRDPIPTCLDLLDEHFGTCRRLPFDFFRVDCRLITPKSGESLPRAGQTCPAQLCQKGLRCASDGICRVPRPLDSECFSDNECEMPLVCRQHCDANGCQMACTAPPAPQKTGAKCGNNFGFPCDEATQCLMSIRRECRPVVGQCFSDTDCDVGEACGVTVFGQCEKLPGPGQFCGNTFRCQPGLVCDFNGRTCRAAPGEGEACAGFEFGLPVCETGLACRDGVCLPPGALGEICMFGVVGSCQTGLTCLFENDGLSRCRPPRAEGELCQNDETCGPEGFCNFQVGTCAARAGAGARCLGSNGCAAGLSCVTAIPNGAICARVEKIGDACSDVCPPGARCEQVATDSACVPAVCGQVLF